MYYDLHLVREILDSRYAVRELFKQNYMGNCSPKNIFSQIKYSMNNKYLVKNLKYILSMKTWILVHSFYIIYYYSIIFTVYLNKILKQNHFALCKHYEITERCGNVQ